MPSMINPIVDFKGWFITVLKKNSQIDNDKKERNYGIAPGLIWPFSIWLFKAQNYKSKTCKGKKDNQRKYDIFKKTLECPG